MIIVEKIMKMFNYVENFLHKSTIVVCMRPLSFVVIEEATLGLDHSELASYSRIQCVRDRTVNLWLNTNAVTSNKYFLIKKIVLKNTTMYTKICRWRIIFLKLYS